MNPLFRNLYIYLLLATFSAALPLQAATTERPVDFVDPSIGSQGLGRVFIGPATPFGMVRPGPDCTPSPNSGWLPMPERVDGFAQTHVSGTGGGPKYGNILIQPFLGKLTAGPRYAVRAGETIECGYYATTYEESGITTEITTSPRTSVYRITYPAGSLEPSLLVDAGFYLGMSPVPDGREAQQFVGSETEIVSPTEIVGYSRIRGGWNNGRAYTVYFCLKVDKPFTRACTWQGDDFSDVKARTDNGTPTGAMVSFARDTDTVNIRIGISFISQARARKNLVDETAGKSFLQVRNETLDTWNTLLERVAISNDAPRSLKRMFYTGLYHTMLMPSDRTGENPLWTDPGVPYYDDFYAIWDTYRTSMPLITLIDPKRQADMVNSLVNIGRRDGYMPDARSGNANGRTQGGSNADIVVADALVKHIEGINYEAAYREMVKDAEVDPGYDHEAHGRGGLDAYRLLGYVPYGIPRAGNRTVEYSICDNALATVAEALGHQKDAQRYRQRSHNWRNLWRPDYEHDGTAGFIMPRHRNGEWLDSLPYGHSELRKPEFIYTPLTFEGPWYKPWWDMFFYEASSWEYSLSMPHDVEMLVEACGGPEAFYRRLNTFFAKGYYNVNNEPSFLSPCLYHWIGMPWKSTATIRKIVAENFNDSAPGLPGNDDSGAMSSWLAFHIMGLYPNAGHPYYLINTPMTDSVSVAVDGGKFTIVAPGADVTTSFIQSAELNGRPWPWSTLPHDSIAAGGVLRLKLGPKPSDTWGRYLNENDKCGKLSVAEAEENQQSPSVAIATETSDVESRHAVKVRSTYFLHGQKRKFAMTYSLQADGGVLLSWNIERNLKLWEGSYRMTPQAVASADCLSFLMPEDGNHIVLPDNETFGIVSRDVLESIKKKGCFELDGTEYKVSGPCKDKVYTAVSADEGATMMILDDDRLPLILRMQDNPLEIDWVAVSVEGV